MMYANGGGARELSVAQRPSDRLRRSFAPRMPPPIQGKKCETSNACGLNETTNTRMELVQGQRGAIPNSTEQCRCESGLRWLDTALDMSLIGQYGPCTQSGFKF